jgi:hypothetical protein
VFASRLYSVLEHFLPYPRPSMANAFPDLLVFPGNGGPP